MKFTTKARLRAYYKFRFSWLKWHGIAFFIGSETARKGFLRFSSSSNRHSTNIIIPTKQILRWNWWLTIFQETQMNKLLLIDLHRRNYKTLIVHYQHGIKSPVFELTFCKVPPEQAFRLMNTRGNIMKGDWSNSKSTRHFAYSVHGI